MNESPRDVIGRTLEGDVIEIGPGFRQFPTAPGARVRYVDRSVPGGRDANWPELTGSPSGPQAEFDLDLDADGLGSLANASIDALVACHVVEHLANPLAAISEFHRVLRPGGKLVLVLPDRALTFDRIRKPTQFSHVLEEYRAGVRQLSVQHIREYCLHMYIQPGVHEGMVRDWHDPRGLTPERIELHRRRSIHVHCWSPEEFASLLVCAMGEATSFWELDRIYFAEDIPRGTPAYEFGVLLRKAEAQPAVKLARKFVQQWLDLVPRQTQAGPRRLAKFQRALKRDLAKRPDLRHLASELFSAGGSMLPVFDPSTLPRLKARARHALGVR